MNLVTEPWIPVLLTNGEARLASLSDVFQEGDRYADLAVRPHERIALLRFLICVAQASLNGPGDIDEWDDAPSRLPGAAAFYLENHASAFDLFDPRRPFLQVAALTSSGTPTPVTKLDFALATGNASTLFDHAAIQSGGRSFPAARLAVMLLTYLNFSPGGRIAELEWGGLKTMGKGSSDDAPCVRASMYHTFVRRANLRGSICANTLTKTKVDSFYPGAGWGRPVWEQMPSSLSDRIAITNATESYLGRLVPLPRLVLLSRDCETMLLGNGFKYLTYPSGPREPSATAIVVKEDRRLLGASGKEIWRELPALIAKRHGDDVGGAMALQDMPDDQDVDVCVGALVRKQADPVDAIEAVLHVPAAMRSDAGRATYEKEVLHAEQIAGRLFAAVSTYYRALGDDWDRKASLKKQLRQRANQHFWTPVEKSRDLLITHVESVGTGSVEATRKVWRAAVHRSAREAYELTCGQESARQLRAFAMGWNRLFAASFETPPPGGTSGEDSPGEDSPGEDSPELDNQEV